MKRLVLGILLVVGLLASPASARGLDTLAGARGSTTERPDASLVETRLSVVEPRLSVVETRLSVVEPRLSVVEPGERQRARVETPTARPTLPKVRRTVRYEVRTRGTIRADLRVFRRQVQETLDHRRGWRAAGIRFVRVPRGGSMTIVLAEASTVPSFSSGCSAMWSCRVGRHVVINQARWLTASPAWNAGRQSLRDYRHMVVNHEVGHFLGLGHAGCPGPGRKAPVMMQQSKGLAGCRFNPWPTPGEIASRR